MPSFIIAPCLQQISGRGSFNFPLPTSVITLKDVHAEFLGFISESTGKADERNNT